MSWFGWFPDDNGDDVNVKTESHSDGSVTQHFLRAEKGDKENHSHAWVIHKPDGRSVAHYRGPKQSRD
jgi:hypothetical protein